MRTNPESVCDGMSGGYGARQPATPRHPSTGPAPSSCLSFPSLPILSQEIPGVIERIRNRRTVAEFAQFLLDAGVINSRRYCSGSACIHDVCQLALDRWLEAAIGDVRCFTPHFEMRLADGSPDACPRQIHATDSARDTQPRTIEVRWKEASVCHWGVGAGLDYLEFCVSKLGSTVLDVMERKSGHAYPLFTPGMALDEASYLYWRGEDDETLALDEDCGDDQVARDAMAQDMITRADITAAFPAWALDYNRPRLTPEELTRVAAEHACSYVRQVAALTSRLDAIRTTAQYCVEEDGPFIGFGAVLCWGEGDLAVQISDDYAQLAWQGEYCDEIGAVTFALNDPAAMRRWMRKIRPNLIAIGLLDNLLRHLSEGE